MLLSDDAFRTVIASTPLISIDLVVTNDHGEILLGKRLNRPAKGTWFVPGGRVRKTERLDDAYARLTTEELGQTCVRQQAKLLGVFEHFYDDNMFGHGLGSASTHYVVLAYAVPWEPSVTGHEWPLVQHAKFRWWPITTAATSDAVHANSKAYLPFLN